MIHMMGKCHYYYYLLRTAEVYFALCEAVVLVLILVCDSAAKTDLDIYLGLAMVYGL